MWTDQVTEVWSHALVLRLSQAPLDADATSVITTGLTNTSSLPR